MKWHSQFSSMWLTSAFAAPIPLWLFLFVMVLGTFTAIELYRYWKISSDLRRQKDALEARHKDAEMFVEALEASEQALEANKQTLEASNKDLQAEKHRLEQQIVELTSRGPRLHGVWNKLETFWHIDGRGTEPVMQIGGRIYLSTSNTDEVLHLLAAHIEEQRLDLSIPLSVRPDMIEDEQVVLYISPPLESDGTRSFTATIVLEDHQNRLYILPRHTFRPTEQTAPWENQDQW